MRPVHEQKIPKTLLALCLAARFARYADDCNIFVRSKRAGQRVMGSIRKFLQGRLRLLVNEEKSTVARPDEIHFLGFRLRKANERTKVEVGLEPHQGADGHQDP